MGDSEPFAGTRARLLRSDSEYPLALNPNHPQQGCPGEQKHSKPHQHHVDKRLD